MSSLVSSFIVLEKSCGMDYTSVSAPVAKRFGCFWFGVGPIYPSVSILLLLRLSSLRNLFELLNSEYF